MRTRGSNSYYISSYRTRATAQSWCTTEHGVTILGRTVQDGVSTAHRLLSAADGQWLAHRA